MSEEAGKQVVAIAGGGFAGYPLSKEKPCGCSPMKVRIPSESQMAEDAAAASADLIQEAEEMLKDQQISRERLEQIAEAAFPLAERRVVTMFGS